MPLPTVDDLLSDIGGAKLFSSMNWFVRFPVFDTKTRLHSTVCTQAGNYVWTVMPMGLASSPGWFQSIMLRVCDELSVFDISSTILCVLRRRAEHVCGLEFSLKIYNV